MPVRSLSSAFVQVELGTEMLRKFWFPQSPAHRGNADAKHACESGQYR